jgi:predicted small lipoprotein YifL
VETPWSCQFLIPFIHGFAGNERQTGRQKAGFYFLTVVYRVMRKYLTFSLLLSVMALTACGTRGSLYLPPPPKTPPPATPAALPAPAIPVEPGAARPSGS